MHFTRWLSAKVRSLRSLQSAFAGWLRLFELATAFSVVLFQCSPQAYAATGILALDEASIPVLAPGRVNLVAITRAGNRLVAVGEHGVICDSDDNGETWRQASVPIDATLTAVAFATPMDGWAAGNSGVILHSGDGGKTWALQLNGLQANQLTLQAAQLAGTQNAKSLGAPNALRRAAIFMKQGPDRPFLSILILNPRQVVVFGAFRMTMRTDDGGKTWTDWSLNVDDAFSHNLYGSVQAAGVDYVVGETGLVFRSTDAGEHFQAVANPVDSTLFGILGTDDGVITYGIAGNLFKSIDRGQSWQPVKIDTTENLTAAIKLASGDILLTAESGRLFISHDHATTFQAVSMDLPMAVFDAVQTADGAIVAVGNRGAMKFAQSTFANH